MTAVKKDAARLQAASFYQISHDQFLDFKSKI